MTDTKDENIQLNPASPVLSEQKMPEKEYRMGEKLEQILSRFTAKILKAFEKQVDKIIAFGPLVNKGGVRSGVADVLVVFNQTFSGYDQARIKELARLEVQNHYRQNKVIYIDIAVECVTLNVYISNIDSAFVFWGYVRSGVVLLDRENNILIAENKKNKTDKISAPDTPEISVELNYPLAVYNPPEISPLVV